MPNYSYLKTDIINTIENDLKNKTNITDEDIQKALFEGGLVNRDRNNVKRK